MGTHSASLRDAIGLSKKNLRYIAVNAIQDVVEAAQTPQPSVKRTGGTFIEGRIPVDDSVLINSLVTRINSRATEGSELSYVVALANFEVGDQLQFAWTAPYALRIEKGFVGTDARGRRYNQEGRFFVAKNAGRFSEFVKKREAEVR